MVAVSRRHAPRHPATAKQYLFEFPFRSVMRSARTLREQDYYLSLHGLGTKVRAFHVTFAVRRR